MIHPRMATMLSIVLTDAAVAPEMLWALLRPAAARTWDQLSVDGDTSTNDTVFLLASGASGAAPVGAGTAAAGVLGAAIEAIARDLARQQAADGEGASTLITAAVTGARDDAEARAVARVGRLVAAWSRPRPTAATRTGAGSRARPATRGWPTRPSSRPPACRRRRRRSVPAPRPCSIPTALRISIAGHLVFDGAAGGPLEFDRAAARAAMEAPEVVLGLDLGLGDGRGEAFGCDLTETYVIENSEYTT